MTLTFWILVITFLFFIAILLGGLIGKVMQVFFYKKINHLYVISGSILVGLLLFEIIPETINNYEKFGIILGLFISILLMRLLDQFFHIHTEKYGINNKIHSVILLVIAIAFHNIPTGLAIGVNMMNSEIGMTPFVATVIFHQIPEGIALVLSIILSGYSAFAIIIVGLFLASMLGFGSWMGVEHMTRSFKIEAILMGSAIGTLGYVSIHEILWKAKKNIGWVPFVSLGLLGLLLIKIYLNMVSFSF